MLDIHTHRRENRYCALYSLTPPRGFRPEEGVFYSVGIHPWVEREYRQGLFCPWEELEALAARPEVRAVGEAGLDWARRPLPDFSPACLHESPPPGGAQREESRRRSVELLERQALLAARVGKPLVLHCVKAVDDIVALHRRLRPDVPWILPLAGRTLPSWRGGLHPCRPLVAGDGREPAADRRNPAPRGARTLRRFFRKDAALSGKSAGLFPKRCSAFSGARRALLCGERGPCRLFGCIAGEAGGECGETLRGVERGGRQMRCSAPQPSFLRSVLKKSWFRRLTMRMACRPRRMSSTVSSEQV